MNKSQLQPGMIVAVKAGRFLIRKAAVLEVGGWRQYGYGSHPYEKSSYHTGHAIAIIADDGRCLPDVVQSAAILDTWESHEATEARKREHNKKAREAQNHRQAAITQEIKAIQPVLTTLGISAFARSDTGEFHLSLSDMKKLVAALPRT